MNSSSPTRLAVLGTMSDLHQKASRYDLACLQNVVADVSPDLLCAEITMEAWESDDLSKSSLELREALAPIVTSTDIVLIPIAPTPEKYSDFVPNTPWRIGLVRTFDKLLRWGQLQADDVRAINGRWFGAFCHSICLLSEMFWNAEDRARWEKQNQDLAQNIVRTVQRDSGRRVLVAVQCQRLHRLLPLLQAHEDLFMIVDYQDL
jgi:hypothetical protein